jgi:hypothetical protein
MYCEYYKSQEKIKVQETHDPSDAGYAGEAHVPPHERRLVRETETRRICISGVSVCLLRSTI